MFRKSVIGTEHIPDSGPVIFASNHAFWFDRLIVLDRFKELVYKLDARPINILAARMKVVSFFVHNYFELLYFKRSYKEKDFSAIEQAVSYLKQARVVLISPEGKQNRGKLIQGKTGVAYLSIKANVPVIPVAIYKERGSRILSFGKPILSEGFELDARSLRAVTYKIMREIALLLPEKKRGIYQ